MTLNHVDRGTGAPIVLVHGWPTNANAWRCQVEALSPSHRVIAVDLPGFGASPPIRPPRIAGFAAALRDLVDELELEDALLVGWSMGGLTVMSYWQQFGGHRLRALGIVDVSPRLLPGDGWALGEGTPFSDEGLDRWQGLWDADPRSLAETVYTIGLHDPERFAAEREWLVQESLRADRETALPALLDAFAQDFRPILPGIDVPVLLLYGAHSTSTTPWLREYLVRTLPDAELVVFPESSHCLMIEEPERFNAALDAFARRTATGRRA